MRILRHEPSVLPGVTLSVVILLVSGMEGIERLTELAVSTATAHELKIGVEQFAIRLTAVVEVFIVTRVAQHLGHTGHGIIGDSIFERLRHGLYALVLIVRKVAVLFEQVHATLVEHTALLHGLKSSLRILHLSFQNEVA